LPKMGGCQLTIDSGVDVSGASIWCMLPVKLKQLKGWREERQAGRYKRTNPIICPASTLA